MVKLSYDLISDAKHGGFNALAEVASAITARNYVLPALDAALRHMHLEDIHAPEYDLDGHHERLTRAYAAMGCVSAAARAARAPHRLKDATVLRILDHIEGILSWTQVLLNKYETDPEESHKCAEFCIRFSIHIHEIACLDRSIEACMFTSPRWINIILRFWSTGVTCPTALQQELEESPVTALMRKFTRHPDGLFVLKETLTGSPKQMRQFCSDFAKRIQLTSKLLESGVPVEAVNSEHRLFRGIYEDLQSTPSIDAALLKHACLRHRVLMLNTFGVRTGRNVLHMAIIFAHSSASSYQQIRSATQIVEGGFVSMFFAGLQDGSAWDSQVDRKVTFPMLKFLVHMTCYPRFMDAFLPAFKSLPQMSTNGSSKEHQEVIDNWALCFPVLRKRCELYKGFLSSGVSSRGTCSNFEHPDKERGISNGVKFCSACNSVSYCSKGCQAEDWNKRHRHECAFMARSSLGLKLNRYATYSQRSKEFQLVLLRDSFICRIKEYEALVAGHPSNLPPRSFIASLKSFHTPEQTLSIQLIEDWKVSRAPAECEAMDERADELVEQFKTGSSTTTRLVEATFRWETLDICLLVEVALPEPNLGLSAQILRHVVRI
ncbi:hypothetical protein BKA70DRAFT_1568044 [Coprinopsis sp. MPI-PUGE-AT-0042]|nr:hypothetical protein BKA70DRAFT_1568044 [Coprinopsis sp. MPI-PUGE-AT-0042]